MTLEFQTLVEQVERMGSMLEKLDFDFSEQMRLAIERFIGLGDVSAVQERIDWVRQSDISGYRGAAPLETPDAEPVNRRVPPPDLPASATIIAADGSQVYPDEQAPVHYFLINTGAYVYHHGSQRTPEQFINPTLYFHKDHVHDKYGRVIRNSTVDDRRTIAEMETLAEKAWAYRDEARPLVTLYDNRLMFLPGEEEGRDRLRDFFAALVRLQDAGALLAGYIDNPFRSKRFVQLLYLMSLRDEDEVKARQVELSRAGDLDGLRDREFFDIVLEPGERSAVMVQNSPQNYTFKEKGESLEIAFFYLKVANSHQSRVVRVDVPMWVARDPQAVGEIHALLLDQCRLQGRNPYPYAITRADELAVVTGKDRDKLDELVRVQLRKRGIMPGALTAKARGKELARSHKRRFAIDTELK